MTALIAEQMVRLFPLSVFSIYLWPSFLIYSLLDSKLSIHATSSIATSNWTISSLGTSCKMMCCTWLISVLHISIETPTPTFTFPSTRAYPLLGHLPSCLSTNSHIGNALSHRDNLESLAYLLFYLLHRSLPWHNDIQLQRNTILEMKQSVSAKVMCKTFPSEFLQFLEYACALSFTEKLDYIHLHSMFQDVLTMSDPVVFDWQGFGVSLDALGVLDVLYEAAAKNIHLEHHADTIMKIPRRYIRLQLMVLAESHQTHLAC